MSRILTLGLLALGLLTLLASAPRLALAQDANDHAFTILIANDDGYDAPGLRALIDSLSSIASIVVAAPAEQQSGASHGITYRDPIFVREVPNERGLRWYAVGARPATVTRLALMHLLDERPDLVVSGINSSENIGLSAWVSGTIGAAREAALLGVPAIAVSRGSSADYAACAGALKNLVLHLREREQLTPGLLLNVNIPAGVQPGVTESRVVRLSMEPGDQRYERHASPRGAIYYWDNWAPPHTAEPGTDVHAFEAGLITITPLEVDQTDVVGVDRLRSLLERRRR